MKKLDAPFIFFYVISSILRKMPYLCPLKKATDYDNNDFTNP